MKLANRLMDALAAVPYLVVLLLALSAATFAFPQTDDFCTFERMRDLSGMNPLQEALNLYVSWTGRYSASFFTAFVGWLGFILPLPFQWTYAAGLMLAVALMLPATYVATSTVVRTGSFAIAALIVAGYLATMPWKLEGVLWLTGAMVYTFGTAFFLAIVSEMNVDGNRPTLRAVLLLVAAAGFNEFLSLVVGTFLVAWTLLDTRTRLARNLIYLATFAIALLIALVAPGNFARNAVASPDHSVIFALEAGWLSLVTMLQSDVAPNGIVWGGLLVGAFLLGWGRPAANWRKVAPFAIAAIAALPIHLVAYPYLLHEPMAGRVLNQCLGLFGIGVLFVTAWLGAFLGERAKVDYLTTRALVFAVGVLLVFSGPTQQFVGAIRDYGPIWKSEQLARYEQLAFAKDLPGVRLVAAFTAEPTWPPLLRGGDVSADPEFWINTCVANFFEVDAVKLAER